MAQKITQWLLITLILSLGFGQLLRFETSLGAFYAHDVLVIAVLALNLPALTHRQTWQVPGIPLIGLGLLVGWIVALTRYPLSDLLIPALYLARLMSYLALFLLVTHAKIQIPRHAFIAAGLTTLVIGLIQYFFLPDMRVFQYLGWDDHLNRLTLPHFDPTYTGVMLVLFALMLNRTQWLIGLLVLWPILLTYSRSTWLSLALTELVRIKNRLVLSIVIFTLFIGILLLPERFGEGTNLLRTYSISSRLQSDWSYIQKYRWELVLGRGMNTLILDAPSSLYPKHATGPNNSYLYILASSGIIGLWGWLVFLRYLYKNSPHKAAILFVVLASLFNNVLLYPFALLWILLAETTVPSAT